MLCIFVAVSRLAITAFFRIIQHFVFFVISREMLQNREFDRKNLHFSPENLSKNAIVPPKKAHLSVIDLVNYRIT